MVAPRSALRGAVSILVAYAFVVQALLAGLAGAAGAGELLGVCGASAADQRDDTTGHDTPGHGPDRADCCLAPCMPLPPPQPGGADADPPERRVIRALYAVAAAGTDHSRIHLPPRARAPPS